MDTRKLIEHIDRLIVKTTNEDLILGLHAEACEFLRSYAYSAESGRRFRANPATPRSSATQGLSARSSVADFRPIWPAVCASILLST